MVHTSFNYKTVFRFKTHLPYTSDPEVSTLNLQPTLELESVTVSQHIPLTINHTTLYLRGEHLVPKIHPNCLRFMNYGPDTKSEV